MSRSEILAALKRLQAIVRAMSNSPSPLPSPPTSTSAATASLLPCLLPTPPPPPTTPSPILSQTPSPLPSPPVSPIPVTYPPPQLLPQNPPPPPIPSPPIQPPSSLTHCCSNNNLLHLDFGDGDLDPTGNPISAVGNEIIEVETPPSTLPIVSTNLRPMCENDIRSPIFMFEPNLSGPKSENSKAQRYQIFESGIMPRISLGGLDLFSALHPLASGLHTSTIEAPARPVQLCGEPPPDLWGMHNGH